MAYLRKNPMSAEILNQDIFLPLSRIFLRLMNYDYPIEGEQILISYKKTIFPNPISILSQKKGEILHT